MQSLRKLEVWQKAHATVLEVYRVTGDFPRSELYGLTSQMRRSAASVPANIAEGIYRGTDGETARFLRIARGSAGELEYHLLLARDLSLLDPETHARLQRMAEGLRRQLTRFIQSLEKRSER